jgi:O-antigen/teichoic acid export membrane protein
MRRRFAVTTLLNAFGAAIGFATGILLTPLMIHTLGPKSYGLWVLITSFSVASGYLSILDLGIQSAVVKFVAEHYARGEQREVNQLVSSSLYVFCGVALVGAAALVVFSRFFVASIFKIPHDLIPMMQTLLYLLAVQTLFEFPGLAISAVVDGLQRYDVQRAIQVAYIVSYALSIYLLLNAGYRLMAISITVLVLAILRTAVFAVVAHRFMPGLRLTGHFDRGLLARVARFSGEIFLLRLNGIVFYTMDKTIIAMVLSSTLLTQYDVASKLRNIAVVFLSLMASQVVPIASKLQAVCDFEGLQKLFLQATKYQMAIALPPAAAVFLLARPFINLWVGPSYAGAGGLAQLFIFQVVFDAAVVVGYNIMIGMNAVRPLMLVQLATTTVLNLAISVFLTPRIGVAGVIWGTVIGTAASLMPYTRLYLRQLDLGWNRFWWEAVLPAIGCTAVFVAVLVTMLRIVPPLTYARMLAGGAVAGLAFAVSFWVFGMTPDERRSARHLLVPGFAS